MEIVEKLIRGRISSVFAKRNFEANIETLPFREPSAKQTFGFFIDANNLHCGMLEKMFYQ